MTQQLSVHELLMNAEHQASSLARTIESQNIRERQLRLDIYNLGLMIDAQKKHIEELEQAFYNKR